MGGGCGGYVHVHDPCRYTYAENTCIAKSAQVDNILHENVHVALTPLSSPRALLACGSECPYNLLSSSWEPETHTSTSDTH